MTQEQPPTGEIVGADPVAANSVEANPVETNFVESDRPARSLSTIGLQFLLGFVVGGLLLIPLSYSSYFTFSALSGAQLGFAILLPLFLGLLTAIWGDRLEVWLSLFLDSLPSF